MKKITLLFFAVIAFAFSFQTHAQCNYTLEMNDSYGDGWSGNTVDVLVNGSVVLDDVTITGGYQGTLLFPVTTGDDVTTNWNGGGNYGYETSYRILDSNGTQVGSGDESSIATGTITASCPSCISPTALTTSNITTTSADLAWTAGDAETLWNVEVVTSGTAPTGTATDVGVSNPFTKSGLTANTDYEYYVQADCGGGETSAWVGPFAFSTYGGCSSSGSFTYVNNSDENNSLNSFIATTPGDYITLTFTAGSTEVGYDDWFIIDSADGTGNVIATGDGSIVGSYESTTGEISFYVDSDGSTTGSTFQYSLSCAAPPTCLSPSTLTATSITAFTADLGWTENGTATAWNVEIVDVTAGGSATGTATNAGVTNPFSATGLTANNDYEFYVQADCGSTDGVSTWTGPFAFSTLIACPAPTTLTATSITGSSASLGWTENGTATLYNIEIVDITAGGTVTGNATVTGVTNPYSATNLASSNDYAFYVQADCGTTNGVSTWSGPRNFTTACAEITSFPSLTDFTNNPPTACWFEAGSGEVVDGPSGLGASDWKSGRAYTNSNSDIVNSNVINLWDNEDREWLLSPSYSIPVGVPHSLVLEVAVTDYASSGTSDATDTDTMGSDDEVQLLVTTDNGATWTNLTTWNVGNQPAVTGTEYIADLTSYSGSLKFAIWASDGTTNNSEDYDFHIGAFSVINNNTLSVNQVELSNFKYFPNPVNDNLSLRAQQHIQNVSVFNMLGQEVLRVAPNTLNSEVNMSEFNAGAYFVKVTIDNVTETIKVIKK